MAQRAILFLRGRLGQVSCMVFFISLHILIGSHIRCMWWPVDEFGIGVPQQPFLIHIKIVNGRVVLMELVIVFLKMWLY
jgi:hypothetical protein